LVSQHDIGIVVPSLAGKNRTVVVRIMDLGGIRNDPYYRVGVDGLFELTAEGIDSSNKLLTHIEFTDDVWSIITNLIEIAIKK
jgi:hypothetical protein